MLNFTNQLVGKIELPVNLPMWRIPVQTQIELNGKVFRKAVVTATWSKWHDSEVLVLSYQQHAFGGFVTVLCEDASTVVMQVENIMYI